jgi:hypothetical protein
MAMPSVAAYSSAISLLSHKELFIPLINDFVLIRNNEKAGLRLRSRQILRQEELLSALGSINDRDQIHG